MRIRTLILLLAVGMLWLGESCSVATTVHFNKDFSGSYTSVMDMSEFIGMAASFDTTGASDPNEMIAQMRHTMDSLNLGELYNGMSGIRDAAVEVTDDGQISFAFKFDNVEALNASFKTMEENADNRGEELTSDQIMPTDFLSGGKQSFTRQKKTLTYSFSSDGEASELLGAEGEDSGNLDMVSSMVDYTMEFTFDRKIKSSDVQGVDVIEKTAHSIKTRVDLGKMLKEGSYSVTVKTK